LLVKTVHNVKEKWQCNIHLVGFLRHKSGTENEALRLDGWKKPFQHGKFPEFSNRNFSPNGKRPGAPRRKISGSRVHSLHFRASFSKNQHFCLAPSRERFRAAYSTTKRLGLQCSNDPPHFGILTTSNLHDKSMSVRQYSTFFLSFSNIVAKLFSELNIKYSRKKNSILKVLKIINPRAGGEGRRSRKDSSMCFLNCFSSVFL